MAQRLVLRPVTGPDTNSPEWKQNPGDWVENLQEEETVCGKKKEEADRAPLGGG